MTSTPHSIACVELFHLLFLDHLGRYLDKRHYVLKGGYNLRFYRKSIRYFENMDLDVRSSPVAVLMNRVDAILGGTNEVGFAIPPHPLYAFQVTDPRASGPKSNVVVMAGNHAGEPVGNHVLETARDPG